MTEDPEVSVHIWQDELLDGPAPLLLTSRSMVNTPPNATMSCVLTIKILSQMTVVLRETAIAEWP